MGAIGQDGSEGGAWLGIEPPGGHPLLWLKNRVIGGVVGVLVAGTLGCGPTARAPLPGARASASPLDAGRGGMCGASTGGAEIQIQVNDQTFRLWSTNAGFIGRAKELRASGEAATAMFNRLADGRDCGTQWTFHVDAAEMSWPAFTTEVCDGRPSDVERDKSHWINDIKRWCPWGTRVLAVDER